MWEFYDSLIEKIPENIKSWNFIEVSLGLAAINSYYNQKLQNKSLNLEEIKHPFISMIDDSSKKIAIVEGSIENKNKIKSKYDVDFSYLGGN